ncbi:transposase [Hymenobacter elongatus]|uniref:DUF4194 domain-containing protein n=1 Tax=Hymenobacter elongatus TaxID=877208 RepID=A0A4Z0PN05_9BACT|nr:transposase [Hymenobacter elongatus]TGE17399.1 DUF4194 domain-containing protein [Hymenobacter elongatus]
MPKPYASAIIRLLQTHALYDDDPHWNLLRLHKGAIRAYFEEIGVELDFNENQGYARLLQPERLNKVPFAVRLFKLVAANGDSEWVVTNNFAFTLTQQLVGTTTRVRWQVEEFHRSFKQLTGAEKCQCRRAQAQRNHLACCYLAWVSLRQFARHTAQTIYQAHQQQWAPYLRQLLDLFLNKAKHKKAVMLSLSKHLYRSGTALR